MAKKEKKAVVFRFSDWPLARTLLDAYELDPGWLDVPFYFASESIDIDLSEDPVSDDESKRICVIASQVGQCFLRDPLVRRRVYGDGPRSLLFASFRGVQVDALRARIERDGIEVIALSDLLAMRERKEKKLTARNLGQDYTEDEGLVDRHRRIREASKLSEAELVARTLKNHESWRDGFTSAAFYLLSRSAHPQEFTTDDPRRTAYFLGELFLLGHASHSLLTRRLAAILGTRPYARAALPLRTVAELVAAAPEEAYELGRRQLARRPARGDEPVDRFYLARALHRHDPGAHAGDLRTALEACVEAPDAGWGVDVQEDLPDVIATFPTLALRWLPKLWDKRDASELNVLFRVVTKHLPKALGSDDKELLASAARAARPAKVRKLLEPLLKRHGLDLEAIAPIPKRISELNLSLDVGVDGATLAVVDPALEGHGDLLRLVNEGRAVGFQTGTDGLFRVRMTGGELTHEEARRADGGTPFVIRSSRGELRLDSGNDRQDFVAPKGSYAVMLHAIDRDGDELLPDYVLRFEKAAPRTKLTRRTHLPISPG